MFRELPELSMIDSIEILTGLSSYTSGPPEIGEEIEQSISFFGSGRISFIRRACCMDPKLYRCSITKESVSKIFNAVLEGLQGPICKGCDMSIWQVTIHVRDGLESEYLGCIDSKDLRFGRYKLSNFIRQEIIKGRKDFNGKPLSFDPNDCMLFDGDCAHPMTPLSIDE